MPEHPAPALSIGPTEPMLSRPTGRLSERLVLRLGLVLSAAFVAAALAAFAAPSVALGHWAGTHLALAGAALVAVGTFMPHFGATLSGSAPERPAIRLAGVLSLATGSSIVVAGVVAALPGPALLGAGLLWGGLAVTAWATLRPGRRSLARRHPIAELAYGLALAEVAVGIGLPVLLLAGWEPASTAWVRLKPAHVWLNLFGFVSLTISATLVYLYPTVLGARIRAGRALAMMLVGAMAGPPLVAIGMIIASQPVAIVGAALAFAGAAGQLAYAVEVWRRRGRWTTDASWHRASIGHLSAAVGWYVASTAVAAIGIVRDGPAVPGWSLGALLIPVLGGWALQALVGSWTHLAPAVAVTDPRRRANQRRTLGWASATRLVVWNGGVLAGWIGLGVGVLPLAAAGVAAFGAAAVLSVTLLAYALLRT